MPGGVSPVSLIRFFFFFFSRLFLRSLVPQPFFPPTAKGIFPTEFGAFLLPQAIGFRERCLRFTSLGQVFQVREWVCNGRLKSFCPFPFFQFGDVCDYVLSA